MRRSLALFLVGPMLGLIAGACAPAGRYVTLADGSKLPAAPTYISAEEMAAKGKNSYGVAATSFAFYPERYVAEKRSSGGAYSISEEEWKKEVTDPCSRFKPANAPEWDQTYSDCPDIRHDCFSVERLFVVPWGSGEGEVGVPDPTTRKAALELSGYRWLPSFGFDWKKHRIYIKDYANDRTLVFSYAGNLIETKSSLEVADFPDPSEFPPNAYGLSKTVNGKVLCKAYFPDPGIRFEPSGKDEYHKLYARPGFFETSTGLFIGKNSGYDAGGRPIFAIVDEEGIQILRYALKR